MIVHDSRNDEIFGKIQKYAEDPTSPNGINGKLFVDFTDYSKEVDFDMLDEEICLGLAKLDLTKYPMVHGVIPKKLQERELSGEFESNALFEYDEKNKDILKNLSVMERRKFLFFKRRLIIPWFFILDLKPNMFRTKSQDLYPWSAESTFFPELRKCIEGLPFREIGRVVIYGSWTESRVPCHRDSISTAKFDHHVNINPGGYRPVYIYDPKSDTKHYLSENFKFYAYNTSDYHGVDPLPHFSYTVRVDGTYNDTVLYRLNML